MFLHELSRKVAEGWPIKVESEEYGLMVRQSFENKCPYCRCDLVITEAVVEHLDGMNRYRAGLHVPGNVLVACRRRNNEKRRDDSVRDLSLARRGWESFLSHDGSRCPAACKTCAYWTHLWPEAAERAGRLGECLTRIQQFRKQFPEFERLQVAQEGTLPELLTKLYSDCQAFAETEIKILLGRFDEGNSKRLTL